MSPPGSRAVDLEGVSFAYAGGEFRLSVPDFRIQAGERVAIVGPSGCGKTTLLSMLAGILLPETGRVEVLGEDIPGLADGRRREFRIRRIGLIFQEFELIEHLPVKENVLLPYLISPVLKPDATARARVAEVATSVGIGSLLARRPAELSHGERQRVAICRALVTDPEMILADEPTGNLDPKTTRTTLDIIFGQVERRGATFLMVTHDHGLLDRFDRVLELDGEVAE